MVIHNAYMYGFLQGAPTEDNKDELSIKVGKIAFFSPASGCSAAASGVQGPAFT